MSIEEDVFQFVAKNLAIRREKLKSSDRLQVDLGMDGDDAVEFFEKFGVRFEVDLSYLSEHWNEYFGPEDISGIGPIVFGLIPAVPAVILGALFHLPEWVVMVITLAIMFGSMLFIGNRNNRLERANPTSRQISIFSLIASVEQKSFAHD